MLKLVLIGVTALCLLSITAGRRFDVEDLEDLEDFMDSHGMNEELEDLEDFMDSHGIHKINAFTAKKCLLRAVKATKGLIKLNKIVMYQANVFVKIPADKVSESNMLEWANHMAFFYGMMKKKDSFLQGCSKHFMANIPKKKNNIINAEVAKMLKSTKSEKDLASMGCKKLALTVTGGIKALNNNYYPMAKKFLIKYSRPVHEAGSAKDAMHQWLRIIGPYWYMLHRPSPASTKCVKKYYDKGDYCLKRAKKATEGLMKLNKYYMGLGAVYVATHQPKNTKQLQGWATHMDNYYKFLKTKDRSLKACSAIYWFTAPPSVRAKIGSAIAYMKALAVKEKTLAKMKCPKLAKTVTNGILALNNYYKLKAKDFINKVYTNAGTGMHEWLTHMAPYWTMLHLPSKAATKCVKDNLPAKSKKKN